MIESSALLGTCTRPLLASMISYCLTEASHHLKQYWYFMIEILWHSTECQYIENKHYIIPACDSHWSNREPFQAMHSTATWCSDVFLPYGSKPSHEAVMTIPIWSHVTITALLQEIGRKYTYIRSNRDSRLTTTCWSVHMTLMQEPWMLWVKHQGPLLLTCCNVNPTMDK